MDDQMIENMGSDEDQVSPLACCKDCTTEYDCVEEGCQKGKRQIYLGYKGEIHKGGCPALWANPGKCDCGSRYISPNEDRK